MHSSVASTVFSSVAFAGNAKYIFAGAVNAATKFNFILMSVHSLYNGITNAVEIRQEHNLKMTLDEYWSIIWRSMVFLELPNNLKNLLQQSVNYQEIADVAYTAIEGFPEISIYVVPLGEISQDSIVPSYSFIDMSEKNIAYIRNIARTAPSVAGATMLCLPQSNEPGPKLKVHSAQYYVRMQSHL